jgi:RNA polymerase sigma factor (sigma-70 family)
VAVGGARSQGMASDPAGSVARLVARYQQPLLRYFLRRKFPLESAEDCVQDTFVRLSQIEYASIDDPESYLFAIASSVAVDKHRRSKSHCADEHLPLEDFELVSEQPSAARVFEGKEALIQLAAALNELPPRTKEVFLLNRLDGLPRKEVAARLGISLSAMEKHLWRAMVHLRERLDD